MVTRLTRKWWLLALRGVIAVLFGLAALVWPGATLTVLVLLFGAYALLGLRFRSCLLGIFPRPNKDSVKSAHELLLAISPKWRSSTPPDRWMRSGSNRHMME